jgi:hypothetical protein
VRIEVSVVCIRFLVPKFPSLLPLLFSLLFSLFLPLVLPLVLLVLPLVLLPLHSSTLLRVCLVNCLINCTAFLLYSSVCMSPPTPLLSTRRMRALPSMPSFPPPFLALAPFLTLPLSLALPLFFSIPPFSSCISSPAHYFSVSFTQPPSLMLLLDDPQ